MVLPSKSMMSPYTKKPSANASVSVCSRGNSAIFKNYSSQARCLKIRGFPSPAHAGFGFFGGLWRSNGCECDTKELGMQEIFGYRGYRRCFSNRFLSFSANFWI